MAIFTLERIRVCKNSIHETGFLWSPSQVLKVWRVPCWEAEEVKFWHHWRMTVAVATAATQQQEAKASRWKTKASSGTSMGLGYCPCVMLPTLVKILVFLFTEVLRGNFVSLLMLVQSSWQPGLVIIGWSREDGPGRMVQETCYRKGLTGRVVQEDLDGELLLRRASLEVIPRLGNGRFWGKSN